MPMFEGINIGLVTFEVILVSLAMVNLFFPNVARRLSVWSYEQEGLDVNPKSRGLSDERLQFDGIMLLVIAALVAMFAWHSAGT